MSAPELIASGPDRRIPPVVRTVMPVVVAVALLASIVVLAARHRGSSGSSRPAAAVAAPVAAELARVVPESGRHRWLLTFLLVNNQATRVVLLRVSGARTGLPLVLAPAQSARLHVDYAVPSCTAATSMPLQVPAVFATREHGRVSVDLAAIAKGGGTCPDLVSCASPSLPRCSVPG